ncbi:MAG: pyroglutamyl-peptidase I [Candidatus Bathyarchaeota archaeon]
MKGKVLLTGFEPFGGSHVNPSIEACRRLEGETVNGHRVMVEMIPLRYDEMRAGLLAAIKKHRPSAIICTGQSGVATINLERLAINVADARIPYNCGTQPVDKPIVEDGPVAYWSRLPLRSILKALRDAGIPSVISNSAGTFGCNHVFYELMHHLDEEGLDIPAGFIHVPPLPEQVADKGTPSMSLETTVRALRIATEETVKNI